MTKKFAVALAERVLSMFLFSFLATYVAGVGSNPTLDHVFDLSLGQKAAAAGIAAAVQLLLSTTVAPFIGDPNSPSLVPKWLLGRVNATPAQAQSVIVSVDDVIAATLKRVATHFPGLTVSVEDVANELITGAVAKQATVATPAVAPAQAMNPPKQP